jgi:hypothetical protein
VDVRTRSQSPGIFKETPGRCGVGKRRSASAGFTPAALTGLVLWLNPEKGLYKDTALTQASTANDDLIAGWQDQSGTNHHATQGTSGRLPVRKNAQINGKPALYFDATNDRLEFNVGSLSDCTAFVVATFAVDPGNEHAGFLGGNTSNYPRWCYTGMTTMNIYDGSASGGTSKTVPTVVLNTYNVHALDTNGTTARYYRDGTLLATQTSVSGPWPWTTIGSRQTSPSNPLNGYVAEVIIYDNVLADSDRSKVTAYLGAKFGLTVA